MLLYVECKCWGIFDGVILLFRVWVRWVMNLVCWLGWSVEGGLEVSIKLWLRFIIRVFVGVVKSVLYLVVILRMYGLGFLIRFLVW